MTTYLHSSAEGEAIGPPDLACPVNDGEGAVRLHAVSTPVSELILRTGDGVVPGADYLPCDPEKVLWGRLPCAEDRAVISVRPGTSLTVDTLSHEGVLPDQGSDPRAFFGRHGVAPELVLEEAVALAATRTRGRDDGPHVVTGPIEVVGARPGDVLAIHIESVERRVPYGVISNRHGRGALPGEMPQGPDTYSAFAAVRDIDGQAYAVLPRRRGGDLDDPASVVSFPLAEFPGIVGVAVPGSNRAHSVPPGAHGGNLDINLMRPGSTVYLPVRVPGAMAYLGDPHFAQGDAHRARGVAARHPARGGTRSLRDRGTVRGAARTARGDSRPPGSHWPR